MKHNVLTLAALLSMMDQAAPFEKAASFDNSGLQVGDFDRPISSVLLCVDCTEAVVEEAMEKRCEAIVSHHPLLFEPAKQLVEQFGKQRVMRKLVRENIALISAHTNLDFAPNGLCKAMADALALTETKPLITQGEEAGYGLFGQIEPQTLRQLALVSKSVFAAGCVKMAGPEQRQISRVAVGSGKGMSSLMLPALSEGVHALITADVSYDQAVEAVALGLCVVDVGHFDSEKACCAFWQKTLQKNFHTLQYPVRLYQAQSSKDVFCQI